MQTFPRLAHHMTAVLMLSSASALFCTANIAYAQRVSDLPQLPAQSVLSNPQGTSIATGQPSPVDSIAAVVNKDIITRNELNERIAQVTQRAAAQNEQLPQGIQLQHQVLETMIMEKAELQLAKEYGIVVDETMLNHVVESVAQSNNLSVPDFRRQLDIAHIPYDAYREQLRREVILQQLKQREVDNKIRVPESEVNNYLATQAMTQKQKVELKLAAIAVRIPEKASPDQLAAAQQKAEQAMAALRSGTSFADVSAKYSDTTEAASGGELGWREQTTLPKLFTDAVATMQPGQLTPILTSAVAFHIVKLEDRRTVTDAADAPVESTHVRHILLKVTPNLSSDDAHHRLDDLRQRLENHSATFEDLAKLYSNDGSASKGGDLGYVYPGDTVPQFERAMNDLKPGEISQPVQSPFGWHLIQVVGRKKVEASAETKRQTARKFLVDQKTQEATADWLRELRDRTYVDIRSDDQ